MRVLLLIPSILVPRCQAQSGASPTMDYYALADALAERYGAAAVDLLGYQEVESCTETDMVCIRGAIGRDAALALLGFRRRRAYDVIFTNGENVGLPLSLLLRSQGRGRPGHVCIGHRISPPKKRLLFRTLGLHRQMDTLFVYASSQQEYGVKSLGIPESRLPRIDFHADVDFWRPSPGISEEEGAICSAGLEWRDYPTLIAAIREMPGVNLSIAAASPWSKHPDETAGRALPGNVSARRYDYAGLRDLYSVSQIVALPLYENDFQAGVTTLLEAMSMGKAVICTGTTGQTGVIRDGENGLYVPPGDEHAWRQALERLLSDTALRRRLGENAQRWVQENASLGRWVESIAAAIQDASGKAIRRKSHELQARSQHGDTGHGSGPGSRRSALSTLLDGKTDPADGRR